MKKILAITGNRADYDLLTYLYKLLDSDQDIEFKLLVTGAHLSKAYGYTIKEIKSDGFSILSGIENLINSDSTRGRVKTAAILMQSMADIIDEYSPDLIIYAGDREDLLAVAIVAAYLEIPSIHFFGGDFTRNGHTDNLNRACASKLATYHFVSIEEHKNRLLAMGESEKRIFVIGNCSLDKFENEPVIEKKDIFEDFNLEKFEEYALLIYHPPVDQAKTESEIRAILDALVELKINTVIGQPNTDPSNMTILKIFDEYNDKDNFYFYKNTDRTRFVNLYRNAKFQIGNSSSGIMEAASIPIPVINIGERQLDRKYQNNVILSKGIKTDVAKAIIKARDINFIREVSEIKNLYGNGESSKRAYELIKMLDFDKFVLKTEDPLRSI